MPDLKQNKFLTDWRRWLPIAAVIICVVGSFSMEAAFRNRHFQECDSSGVYALLHDFPQSGLDFTAIAYHGSSGIISKNLADKILNDPRLAQITAPIYKKYPKDFIAARLTQSSLVSAVRFAEISVIGIMHLPYVLQSVFALPLSSTYSAGTGLIYGIIASKQASYLSFMSRTMLLNLLVFHAFVLLLFFSLLKLKTSPWSAALVSLLALFSISLYSSGFSAGSIAWMLLSGMLWLYLIIAKPDKSDLLKSAAIISGILVFFNYLIVCYWLALLCAYWLLQVKPSLPARASAWLKSWIKLLKSQALALALFVLCALIFYPTGQGVRAIPTWHSLGSDIYYTVLNYFNFYSHSGPLEILQFCFGVLLLVTLFVWLVKNFRRSLAAALLLCLAGVYVLFVAIKFLGFGPTRHMLFLAPAIFLGIGLALNEWWQKLAAYPKLFWGANFLLLPLAAAGFTCIKLRQFDTADATQNISVDKNVSLIGIYDCSVDLYYRQWPYGIPADFINPKKLSDGKTYLYLSQTISFTAAMSDWQKQFNINYSPLRSETRETFVYFMAYNPGFKDGLYTFTRPNNLYLEEFKVNAISPK